SLQWGRRVHSAKRGRYGQAHRDDARFNGVAEFTRRRATSPTSTPAHATMLQWGRRVHSAKSPRAQSVDSRVRSGFNGVAEFTRRRASARGAVAWPRGRLQWGRRVHSAKRPPAKVEIQTVPELQWGRRVH